GFRLVDSAQGLSLAYRFSWIGYAALAVFLGRLALGFAAHHQLPARALAGVKLPHLAGGEAERWLGLGLIVVAALLPLAVGRNVVDIATLVLIYVMLGTGLNIVVGLAGLLDLGYVAFYAVGAYSYALLSSHFGLSFWLCLPLAGLFAAGFGILLGFPVLRLRGDYLAIVTLGFGEIIRIVIINWQSLTGGPNGLGQIARPGLFGLSFAPGGGSDTFAGFFGLGFSPTQRVVFLYYVILALALLTIFFVQRIRRLPLGRAWEALRDDEIACKSLGINPTTIKLAAFALGAGFAGFAGSFFATRQGFISPESFTFMESAIILAIVVLGGMGSQVGIALAALVLVGLPEWFRDFQQYRMLAFGGAMVLIMLWRPQGLLSHRTPTVHLGEHDGAA
ncbi:MAG TPA: high-affinity branched-chain amino acid ABC transporter permease LivM, partial [Rhizomicrobium sp.]|nr:high-affinity branched-chain amino acid ABC transporter permease LivM [Rhizomicrobium sp.]